MKKKSNKLPKERNPFVQHLINKKGGGFHYKPNKSLRSSEKANLKKFVFTER